MSESLPRISAIVLTYQFENYIAQSIESVLAQDYPQELLEVVVIDDGSTDGTRDALAPYLDRVRYIHKENGGLISSVNRGFAEATGELLALQSGDDMWTPQKLALQVDLLRRRPEVGLVYGDMQVVDNDQRVLHRSFWEKEGIVPHRGRVLGPLVRSNFVSGGTMIVRSQLRERFHPLPAHAGWEDWWTAVRVAEVAELDYVSEPMLSYRFHGANMNLGADRAQEQVKAAHEMPFRRWLLTDLQLDSIAPEDLLVAARLYEHCVVAAAQSASKSTQEVVPRDEDDAERIGEYVRAGYDALARREPAAAMRAAARAFGRDLHDPRARGLLEAADTARRDSKASAPVSREGGVSRKRSQPRVTLGIATFNRDTYLAEAMRSALEQDYDDFEVLVVDDGSTNPAIAEILSGFEDSRLRVVRHEHNKGIAEAYNTMVEQGRGELIAMLGDDDICLPGRLTREVAIFDAHPQTGVVHGDALVIDAQGRVTGRWDSRDFTQAALLQSFLRSHNYLVDPTRMVHRRVYEAVGGYDSRYPIAQDFHFWLRALRAFRFRHCPGGPLIGFRRHGENTSEESSRAKEIADVERALGEAIEHHSLRELVPELDWAVLDPLEAEHQALERLAAALEARKLPLPGLAARVRSRIGGLEAPRLRKPSRDKRLMMTAFGWNDSGGGTTVPRLAAKELARRGWEVSVFHAATRPSQSGRPYEVVESEEDGVRLLGVHNRSHGLWDLGNPLRELDDPPITAAFASALDRLRPQVVHFHNLHNLGAALIDQVAARGLPSFFSTHNYWLICPRAYLLTGTGELCPGPGDGSGCAGCVSSPQSAAHKARLEGIRARVARGVTACLTVSEAVRRTLLAAGYPTEMLDVVRQGMPHDTELWDELGSSSSPGRGDGPLTVGFVGSAYPHKGPQLLVAAAQRTEAELRVQIHGEVPEEFAAKLIAADERGVVELCGAFLPSELPRVLGGLDAAALPSIWWDCAPLAASECLAAGVPVLAPRLGGLAEAVRDEVDGLLFEAGDPDDLARCLDRLSSEDGLLERLQDGIEAPRRFSDYVDELEAYYEGERPGAVGRELEAADLTTRWHGDHGLRTSLSIVNGRVCERLNGQVQRVSRDGEALDGPLRHAADVEVRHQWPPVLDPPASGRLAVIQPWEYGAIPREWIGQLVAHVDELWVPSEYVRRMYLQAGLEPERVVTIPNGVDLERLKPGGERFVFPSSGDPGSLATGDEHETEHETDGVTRFLFVGGLIWRKGPDVLLAAWKAAFPEREDVLLVVKDVGATDVYRHGERDEILEHARSGELPRILVLDRELDEEQMARLYRACDVLVHPYRGEGFAMPVLEAMACGLPVIATADGPTDEFCPPEAGWRIDSQRAEFPTEQLGPFPTLGHPWVLEPSAEHLAELLRAVAEDPEERRRRGALARVRAERYGWQRIAELYDERLAALARRPPLRPVEPREFEETVSLRVLATPAWRGQDRLSELLEQWRAATDANTDACLYLLADPRVDGTQEQLYERVLGTGVELEQAADVTVLMEPIDGDADRRLHVSVDAYVPLHDACHGHARLAIAAGSTVLSLDNGSLERFLTDSHPSLLAV